MPAEWAGADAEMRVAAGGAGERGEGGLGAPEGIDQRMPEVVHYRGKRGMAGGVPRLEAAWLPGCAEPDGAAGGGDAAVGG